MRTHRALHTFALVAMVGTCNGAMDTSIDRRSARPDGTNEGAQVISEDQKALPPSERATTKLQPEAEEGR